jgi:hypothetical protein
MLRNIKDRLRSVWNKKKYAELCSSCRACCIPAGRIPGHYTQAEFSTLPGEVADLVASAHGDPRDEYCALLTDKGCAIPIEHRSAVCLTFVCAKLAEIMSERDREKLRAAAAEFHRLRIRRCAHVG